MATGPTTTVKILQPNVQLVDPKTGIMTRDWYNFFRQLFAFAAGSNLTTDDVQRLLDANDDAPSADVAKVNRLIADAQLLIQDQILADSQSSTGPGNPTAFLGLAATIGVATTFMRSDGAPALSQAIQPTWTKAHTFSPAAGIAMTINGVTVGTPVVVINNQATTGAQTATFAATNKPGGGTTAPAKWIPVQLDGGTYYVPAWP